MNFYCPTGRKDLDLVAAPGCRRWLPQVPDQPIFYPVTTFDYAEKIARDWNSILPDPDDEDFVTRFKIELATAARRPVREAGGREHEELWVPAEESGAFNDGIVGPIEVVARYRDGQRVD